MSELYFTLYCATCHMYLTDLVSDVEGELLSPGNEPNASSEVAKESVLAFHGAHAGHDLREEVFP